MDNVESTNKGGAPLGNQNAVKGKRWADAIDRALAKRCKGDGIKALDELAEKLLQKCDEADLPALKELGDRIDGKAMQAVEAKVSASVTVQATPLDENI
jgi:hypothetical protein